MDCVELFWTTPFKAEVIEGADASPPLRMRTQSCACVYQMQPVGRRLVRHREAIGKMVGKLVDHAGIAPLAL